MNFSTPEISRPIPGFQTPEEELIAGEQLACPRRSSAGPELDALVSYQHARSPKTASWLYRQNQPGCFEEWKRGLLRELREALVIPQALGAPADPVLIALYDRGDYIEEHVEISLTPPVRVMALVTIPKNGRKRHPALVMLHSHGWLTLYGKEKFLPFEGEPAYLQKYRDDCYGGKALLAEFARAGYLCIAVDAIGFGMRMPRAAADPAEFDRMRRGLSAAEAGQATRELVTDQNQLIARMLGTVGLSMASVTATDDLRTLDYLATRPDVDAARIGCAGLSMGSYRVHYLAALDERIRAAVSACWISTHEGIVDYNIPNSMGFFALPGALYRHYDLCDLPAAIAPKPFLAISGWKDILMEPRGAAASHRAFRRAWEAAGAPRNLGSLIYDAPHEFNGAMQAKALEFLATFLGKG